MGSDSGHPRAGVQVAADHQSANHSREDVSFWPRYLAPIKTETIRSTSWITVRRGGESACKGHSTQMVHTAVCEHSRVEILPATLPT